VRKIERWAGGKEPGLLGRKEGRREGEACVWASEGGEAEPKRRKRKEGKEDEGSGS